MDQTELKRRFGYAKHTVVGKVGRFHVIAGRDRGNIVAITLEERTETGGPNFYQILFHGEDALSAFELGVQSGDLIIVTLDEVRAKAYLNRSVDPPAPLGYFECRGKEPFVLSRPALDAGPADDGARFR
jgi:hypothetical protein